jgi:hypothetical protein
VFYADSNNPAFKPLATAELLEAGKNQNWAPLALADGKLLIDKRPEADEMRSRPIGIGQKSNGVVRRGGRLCRACRFC